MPTILTHSVVGGAMAAGRIGRTSAGRRLIGIAAFLALLPDADGIGFRLGVPYSSHFGHRGFTHSLVFAAVSSLLGVAILRGLGDCRALRRWPLLLLVAASHPLLDMLTNGGLGCALFAPFRWDRLFFPYRPIPVAPMGMSSRLAWVMAWEIALLWPAALIFWVINLPMRNPRARWIKLAAAGVCLAIMGAAFAARINPRGLWLLRGGLRSFDQVCLKPPDNQFAF